MPPCAVISLTRRRPGKMRRSERLHPRKRTLRYKAARRRRRQRRSPSPRNTPRPRWLLMPIRPQRRRSSESLCEIHLTLSPMFVARRTLSRHGRLYTHHSPATYAITPSFLGRVRWNSNNRPHAETDRGEAKDIPLYSTYHIYLVDVRGNSSKRPRKDDGRLEKHAHRMVSPAPFCWSLVTRRN